MTTTMEAIVYAQYGSPDVLQVREVEKPEPKDDEILVRVRATTVTPVDTAARKGEPFIFRFFIGLTRPKNPILGGGVAGEIEAVGKDVTSFKKGDQVFGASDVSGGAHAEYICLPEGGALAIKPVALTFEEAVAVSDGGVTALPFLRDEANIQPGQKILIIGASGAIGTSSVQLAKHFGAKVTGVCSTANMELVKSLGADEVIDYTKEDFTKNGETYDIIFDAVGKRSFSECKEILKENGIYLTTISTPKIFLEMFWTSRARGKKAIFAMTGLRPASEKAKDLNFLKELVKGEKIKPVIDRRYSLAQIAEAHSYVEKGHKKGSIVISL